MSVVLETTLGALTLDLYTAVRPQLSKNFLKLCKTKYYNFHLFHNVQRGFLAQSGDPEGTGRGGESVYGPIFGEQAKYLEAEDTLPKIRHSRCGLLSMVSAGRGKFGSQFFLTLESEGLEALDEEHVVFGEVVEGEEVLDKFNDVISDDDHRPYQDVRITHTVILDDPFEDPKGLVVPSRSPSPDPERLKTDRLAADADLSADDDLTNEQITEKRAAKEATAQATILEMVGDLPDADCAPPENVLFICKLNPVTSDDDLKIILSRFGKVVSCEVIRDQKSGDSLQYTFVEFAEEKSCETAYFKMDNVLIDDRRIHVDFSQSVSKFQWKGKGRLEVLDGKREDGGNHGGGRGGPGGGRGGGRGGQRGGYNNRSSAPRGRDNDRSPWRRRDSPPRRDNNRSPPRRRRERSETPPRKQQRRDRSGSPPSKRRDRSDSPPSKRRDRSGLPPKKRRNRSETPPRKQKKRDRLDSPSRRIKDRSETPPRKQRNRSRSGSRDRKDYKKKSSHKERRRSRSRDRDRRYRN